MKQVHWWLTVVAGVLLVLAMGGCSTEDPGSAQPGDDASDAMTDQGMLDVPIPTDAREEDLAPPDLTEMDTTPPDLPDEEMAPPDLPDEEMAPPDLPDEEVPDLQDEDGPPQTVQIVGRVWNYYASYPPLDFGYDYPWEQVTVSAYGTGSQLLATTLTNVESCTPWEPPDPYVCGMFELALEPDLEVMLKATDNPGYKDTLSQIFPVEPGTVRIMVMVGDSIVTLLSTVWAVDLDDSLGHVAGIVAVASGDVHAAPYEEYIGNASVAITPSDGFGEDYLFVYYDSSNPLNTSRTSTDPENPVFAAINVPPRGIDDPYEITVTHATYEFEPVSFAVQPDVLTFLILSPEP